MKSIDYSSITNLQIKEKVLVKIKNEIGGEEWFISLKSLSIKNNEKEFSVSHIVDGNWDLSLLERKSKIIAYAEKPKSSDFMSLLKAKSYVEQPVLLLYSDGGMISGVFHENDKEIVLDTQTEEVLDHGLIGFLPLTNLK